MGIGIGGFRLGLAARLLHISNLYTMKPKRKKISPTYKQTGDNFFFMWIDHIICGLFLVNGKACFLFRLVGMYCGYCKRYASNTTGKRKALPLQ
jgi:hypothetical protein